MNRAKQPQKETRRFSFGWSIGVAIFHFGATFALAGIVFVVGMGSFTEDVSSKVAFWCGVQWLWTPLAMAAWDPNNMHNEGQVVGLAFLWSCFIGVTAGFVIPFLRRWSQQPLYPPQAPSA